MEINVYEGVVLGACLVRAWAPVLRFPAMSGKELLALLCRKPLEYQVTRQVGSHRTLKAEGRPDLLFAFHDRTSIAPGLVRKILLGDVGLEEAEARKLLGG